MTVTISTKYNTATDPQRYGEDVVTILRATARHTKWRKLYEGPLPADENVIFQTFAAMAAKRLSDE